MERQKAPWHGQDAEHGRIYDAAKQRIEVDSYELKWDLVPIGWPRDGKSFYGANGLMLFQSGVGYLIDRHDEDLNESQVEKKKKKTKKDGKKRTAAAMSSEGPNQAPHGRSTKKRSQKSSNVEDSNGQEARGKAIKIKAYPNVEKTYKAHFEVYDRPTSYDLPLEDEDLCEYLKLCWIHMRGHEGEGAALKGPLQQVLRDAYQEAEKENTRCTETLTFKAWEYHGDDLPAIVMGVTETRKQRELLERLRKTHWLYGIDEQVAHQLFMSPEYDDLFDAGQAYMKRLEAKRRGEKTEPAENPILN